MISVLHLTSSFGFGGGAEKNLLRLVCNMDRSRFRNTVVTMTDLMTRDFDFLQSQLARVDVPVYSLRMRPGVPSALAAARLLRVLRQTRPCILQTWMYHADLLGLLVGKLARVPSIAWNIRCSSMDMAHYRWLSAVVLRTLVPLSSWPDVVVANSESGIQAHKALGYAPRRWLYIPNLLDLDEFRPDPGARSQVRRELGLAENAILIGLVARYHPMKDHANFVAAMGLLAADDSTVHFVLVGRGADTGNTELMQLVRSTGAEHRFHFSGHTLNISRITAALDVACSSSAFGEGSSNALIEAMACGVPCVATDVGDSRFIIQDTGKIVPSKDPAALAQACRELIRLSLEGRGQLGLRARERVKTYFSVETVVARYQSLYEQIAPKYTRLNDSTRLVAVKGSQTAGKLSAQRIL
jgi:glycosyltransferase involved in cell wall biosynthesis